MNKKIITVCVLVIALILLFLILINFVIQPIAYTQSSYREQFGIVLDAGSSHTEVLLYKWDLPTYENTGRAYEESSCDVPGGGISSYSNATEAAESFDNCLTEVLEMIPSEYKNDNPNDYIWLGATAGMRLLEIENKALSDDIINNIARKLGRNGDARILSGEEEGLYGWISSNYINGNFRFKIPNKRQIRETVGALDMGGASTQISFTPEDPNSIENNYKLAVDIFGDTYNTYSRTYLCYGANEAVRRILAYSLMEAGYNSVISNPCFHTGDSLNYTYDYFNGKPCTEDLIPSGSLDSNQTYMFIGASNFTTCQDLVAKAMNFSVELPGGNTIDYNPPPNAKGNFFGFSSYYYNANFFNFENLNASNFNNFKDTVSRHCFSSWSDVLSEHEYNGFLRLYCAQGSHIIHVLSNGYGFDSTATDWFITFARKIDGFSVGWTLGYMLNQTNGITPDVYGTVYPYNTTAFIIVMVVLAVAIIPIAFISIIAVIFCVKSYKDN